MSISLWGERLGETQMLRKYIKVIHSPSMPQVNMEVSAPSGPLECIAQKRREAVLPMHELAVWKPGKQRQYNA